MQRSCRKPGALVAAVGVLLACAAPPAPPSGRSAAATIAPLADLLRRVAGDGWTVRTIVPPGTSPHVFEPAPRHVRALAGARVLVAVGAGYDAWAATLARAAASSATLVDASEAVGVHARAGPGEPAHGHGDLAEDPHWWLSPERTRRLVPALVAALASADPLGRSGYADRGAALDAELAALDAAIGKTLAPFRGAAFVSSHAAWAWFADRYGLRPLASIEPVPGREPSPRELATLVRLARRERLSALFTEPQFPASAARVVAHDVGLRLETIDPIGGGPGTSSYPETLRAVAAGFARSLSRTSE